MKKMDKKKKVIVGIILCLLCVLCVGGVLLAGIDMRHDKFADGVSIGGIDVSGMTYETAYDVIDEYVQQLTDAAINLHINENVVTVSASELGFSCDIFHVAKDALGIGKTGNVVKRFKEIKELEKNGKDIPLEMSFSEEKVRQVLTEKCTAYDVPAVNAGLKKTSSGFEVTEGSRGIALDVEASFETLWNHLNNGWDGTQNDVTLAMTEVVPKGEAADLEKVKDLLGSATTSYASSGKPRRGNVERGAGLINGTVVYPGEEFSTYEVVSPITIENGYFMAASYAQGQVVDSAGGGICQVSTTLYNALLKAELQISERSNHSMIVTYVDPAMDAAIAGTWKDLKFVNNTDYPIYIEGITAGRKITFNIYGVETRSESREVSYVSETISETEPTVVFTQTADAFGTMTTTQSAHKGIVAKLWKIVKENGVEVSREMVNQSKYSMSPKYVSIGTANATPEMLNELNAAIATNNEDAVKAVVSKYVTVETMTQESVDPNTMSEGVAQPTEAPVQTTPTEAPVQQNTPEPVVPTPEPQMPVEPTPDVEVPVTPTEDAGTAQ